MTAAMCPSCGQSFEVTRLRKKFCSRLCVAASKRKPPIIKTCEICQIEFETNRFDIDRGFGRFCSRRCANIGKQTKQIKSCEFCGKAFLSRPLEDKRFCSYTCSAHSRMVYKVCPICKNTFWAKPSTKKYCSAKCKGVASRKKLKRTCGGCGKIYFSVQSRNKAFCSARCAGKFSMENEFINTTYQGFTQTIKEVIRQRDNYTCRLCGKTEQKRAFSIHHINYNKAVCHPLNLITLCDTCHPKTNYNRKYWQELFTEMMYT